MHTFSQPGKVFKNLASAIGVILVFRAALSYSLPALELLRSPSDAFRFIIFLKNGISIINVIFGICIFISFKILDYAINKNTQMYKHFVYAWFILGSVYVVSLLNSLQFLLIKELPRYLLILIAVILLLKVKPRIGLLKNKITNFRISGAFKFSRDDIPTTILTLFILRLFVSPITSTDSLFYWTGLADNWVKTWPNYPNSFGPGLGSDMSFNYLNLNSGIITFVSLALKISLISATNLLSLFVIATIFVSLKTIKIQNEKWIFLLILSISGLQLNFFGKNGYTILFALSFLFASIFQSQNKSSKILYLIPGIISLIGPIGLLTSCMMSAILVFNIKGNFLWKIKQSIFAYIPVFIGFVVLYIRSNSIFYPFILWPAKFDSDFTSTLITSKQLVFNNSIASLGLEANGKSAFYLFYKYLMVNSAFSGGIIVLILLAYVFREKINNTKILLNYATITILILFVSQLYWQRYLLGAMGIYLAILCVYFSKKTITIPKSVSYSLAFILVLKYALIIGGTNLDSYQSSNERTINGKIETYLEATSPTSNRLQEFGSAAQAWSDIEKLIFKGDQIYMMDEIGSSLIDNQKQLVNSQFPSISNSSNGIVNLSNFMRQNNKSFLFVNSQTISQKEIGRFTGRNKLDESNNLQFIPCTSWPTNNSSPPHVLWKLKKAKVECKPQVKYIFRKNEILDQTNLKNQFEDKTLMNPETIHSSFIAKKPGKYSLTFTSSIRNYIKASDAINYENLQRENTLMRITQYRGLSMALVDYNIVTLSKMCEPLKKLCQFEIETTNSDEIIQLELNGFTDIKNFSITKVTK